MRTAYFLTHPIQYQAPLLRALAAEGCDLTVVYASTKGVEGYLDRDFGVQVTWDVPLLEGYSYDCLHVDEEDGGFLLQFNRYRHAIRSWLSEHPTDAVWVHGWGHPFNLAALLESSLTRRKLLLRGESHLGCLRGRRWWNAVHRQLMGFFFRRVDHFLAVGTANHDFYRAYGVPERKITAMPYVVDNEFFRLRCEASAQRVADIKASLRLAPDRPVVLYAGKLTAIKSVDTLIRGVHATGGCLDGGARPFVVIVGDGELRTALQGLAESLLPGDVHFAGFQPQQALPDWYSLCDIFVLPSTFEPWGLVVNEAMNAAKAVVVSSKVGSHFDLVEDGVNGGVFEAGNSDDLARILLPLMKDREQCREAGMASLRRISKWGIPEAVAGFKSGLSTLEG